MQSPSSYDPSSYRLMTPPEETSAEKWAVKIPQNLETDAILPSRGIGPLVLLRPQVIGQLMIIVQKRVGNGEHGWRPAEAPQGFVRLV
jgi:hypothetical protein